MKLYAYVGNDPLNKSDPTGLCGKDRRVNGCIITGSTKGKDNPNIQNISPDNAVGINAHAMAGDGSRREVDFTKVNLGDLGGKVQKFASQPGNSLSSAVDAALRSGSPQAVSISNLNAGGGQGGLTGPGQIGGIGRFAVDMSGTVTPGANGLWTLQATVTGHFDVEDYPHDSRRGPIAGALNDAFGGVQNGLKGKDYLVTFFGSQTINVYGIRP